MFNHSHKITWFLFASSIVALFIVANVRLAQAAEVAPVAVDQIIKIQKQSKFDFANPNTDVDYQIIVTNTSVVPVSNIVLTESWPNTFTVNGLSGGFLTWTIPTLLPGQSVTKDIKLHIPAETLAGYYSAKTMYLSQQPASQDTLDYNLEVRAVTILSSELPGTDGFSSLYFYAGALLLQLSIIASVSITKFLRLN